MKDWIDNCIIFCLIFGVIGGAGYLVYRFIDSTSVSIRDQRCSTIAWRATQIGGIEAGKAADAACRQNNK